VDAVGSLKGAKITICSAILKAAMVTSFRAQFVAEYVVKTLSG
jgi:hypothetical protein